jgi:hypothetical protein
VSVPVLVGQAPARTSQGRGAFRGPASDRLARLLGVSTAALRASVEPRNLLDYWPGPVAAGCSGDAFPMAEGRAAAERLAPTLAGRRVLLAGRAVAWCFAGGAVGLAGPRLGLFEWAEHECGFAACIVPHPSGASRWWNDPANRELARRELLAILGLEPEQTTMCAMSAHDGGSHNGERRRST